MRLAGPSGTLKNLENRDPGGTLAEPYKNRKTGTRGPSAILVGPYKKLENGDPKETLSNSKSETLYCIGVLRLEKLVLMWP